MAEAPSLEEDEYSEFYEIDEPVVKFEEGVNEIAEEQAKDKVWSEVISLIEQGRKLEKIEMRGKAREVLVARSMFDPEVFKMKDRVLMFTKAANKNQIRRTR